MTLPANPGGHPAGTGRPTARTLARAGTAERVIPGAAHRAARDFLAHNTDQLAGFTCAERVTAVVAVLVTPPGDAEFTGADLLAALREPDTVDLALDMLTDAGLGCAGPA